MSLLDVFRKKKAKEAFLTLPEKVMLKPKAVAGLALGGGGARGFAHIGVLKAFEEAGIDFPIVTGTSVGSIVGSLYAYGLGYEDMIEIAKGLNEKDIRTSRLFFKPSPSQNIENLMKKIYGDITFADLKRKFSLVTVDVISGDEIVLSEGNLAKAVSGSCAVPLVFSPVEWGDYRLVDGGLSNVVPADVARINGAEVVISVDINSTRGEGTTSIKTLDTFFAIFRIAMKATAYKCQMNSDLIIKPDLKAYKSTKLSGSETMIEEGYRATMERMDDIMGLLGIKKR